jgi:transposase-like protein
MMTTTARGREFWEQHIASLRSSGKSSAAYAREHDLSVYALGWWRRKLNRPVVPAGSSSGAGVPKAPRFVALKVAEPTASRSLGMMMLFVGDVRLQMSELPPAAWLAELGHAMRGVR